MGRGALPTILSSCLVATSAGKMEAIFQEPGGCQDYLCC